LLIQKRYSYNTIKIYCNYFKDYFVYFEKQKLEDVTIDKINSFILELIKLKNISISQKNQRINTVKFYYETLPDREKQYYKLYLPKKENKLPKVLSKNEVKNIWRNLEK
jgi:integrase/recombinase XerD